MLTEEDLARSEISFRGWLRWWKRALSLRARVPDMRRSAIEALEVYAEMVEYLGFCLRALMWVNLSIPFTGVALIILDQTGSVPWWWIVLCFLVPTLLLSVIEYLASIDWSDDE